MIYFTADLHFNHDRIREYCDRPFSGIEEMNEEIISRWNSKVSPRDSVYVLGDFGFFRSRQEAEKMVSLLRGSIYLLKGNHDKKQILKARNLAAVWETRSLQVGSGIIFLSHYAHRVWNKSHHGSWHLYGHSHGNLPEDPSSMSFDVGVDCCDFYPLSLEEIAEKMLEKHPNRSSTFSLKFDPEMDDES